MNTEKIFETIEDIREFAKTMGWASTRRKRLQRAADLLDNEMKTFREEEFVNEVLSLAKEKFEDNITSVRISEIFATVGIAMEEDERKRAESAQFLETIKNKHDRRSVQIKQYTLDGKYIATHSSINDAARAVSISPTTLSCALKRKTHSSAGYIWKRADDETPVNSCIVKTCRYPKTVGQYTADGIMVKRFDSINKAAKSLGVCSATMRKVLDQDSILRGYIWKTIDENQ